MQNDPINWIDPLGWWQMVYSPGEAQALSTQQNLALIEAQVAPKAAIKTLKVEGTITGIGALALSGQEEIAGPLAYAAFGTSVGATTMNAVNRGSFTRSDAVDLGFSVASLGAGKGAALVFKDADIAKAVNLIAGSGDVVHSLYGLLHPQSDNLNSNVSGSNCSQ